MVLVNLFESETYLQHRASRLSPSNRASRLSLPNRASRFFLSILKYLYPMMAEGASSLDACIPQSIRILQPIQSPTTLPRIAPLSLHPHPLPSSSFSQFLLSFSPRPPFLRPNSCIQHFLPLFLSHFIATTCSAPFFYIFLYPLL